MSQPQYTPAQVLETARRAEADGQPDYADQAYRHILEVFPGSPEAVTAREAIAQRQQYTNGAGDRAQDRIPNLNDTVQPQAARAQQPASAPGPAPLPHTGHMPLGSPAAGQPAPQAAARPASNNLQLEPAAAAGGATEVSGRSAGFPLPHPRNYPLARLLATLTVILGTLALLVALLIGAASVLDPATTQVLTGTPLVIPNIMFAMSVFGFGLVLCLIGLLAHAVFHTARNLTAYTAAEHARLRRRDG